MAKLIEVNAPVRKPLFEGVQGENEARSIQFDITPWVDELGNGAVTATAKRSQDSQPYPVTVTKDGNAVTWKPTSTDTAFAGVGSFQLEYTVDDVLAKTCIWSTMVAPSLDPAGDPPDPYDNWLAEMRQVAADALQSEQNAEDSAEDAEAWAVGQRGGVDVPSTDPTYENNAKYWAEQSLANQYGAYIVKSASGDIASFNDGGDDIPMKSLKVAIVPKQAGSGDPSPSNVRPITGWTDADVTVTGKNAFGGLDLIQNNDFELVGGWYRSKKPVVKAATYKWTGIGFTTSVNTLAVRLNDGVTSPDYLVASGAIIPTMNLNVQNDKYIEINYTKAGFLSAVSVFKGQLELGTTATEYEPYTGTTTPVPLGQTVYGGEVDVVSGEMTLTHGLKTLTNSNNYAYIGGSGAYKRIICNDFADAKLVGTAYSGGLYCNMLEPNTVSGVNHCAIIGGGPRLDMYFDATDSNYASLDSFKSWVSSHNIQVAYELATPTTVQLTPTQVATLLGTNNIWSDAGSVAVEYRADPTLAYNELANVIVSLGGNI